MKLISSFQSLDKAKIDLYRFFQLIEVNIHP